MDRSAVGQSLVEFALVLPLLVLLVAGIFDLGRAFFSLVTITNAAREGARYGTIPINRGFTQGVCNATWREAESSGITLEYSEISVACSTTITCASSGTPMIACSHNQSIIVRVTYTYDRMIFRFFFPSGITMQKQVEMQVP